MSKKPNDLASDIVNSLRSVTSDWTKTKKAEERSPASRHFRMQRMTKQRGVSFKDAAAEILLEAMTRSLAAARYRRTRVKLCTLAALMSRR